MLNQDGQAVNVLITKGNNQPSRCNDYLATVQVDPIIRTAVRLK